MHSNKRGRIRELKSFKISLVLQHHRPLNSNDLNKSRGTEASHVIIMQYPGIWIIITMYMNTHYNDLGIYDIIFQGLHAS